MGSLQEKARQIAEAEKGMAQPIAAKADATGAQTSVDASFPEPAGTRVDVDSQLKEF